MQEEIIVNIAVLGYGTVGSGVVEVLTTNRETITKRAGESIDVKYVLDLRDFPGDPIQEKIVHDYQTILDDPDVKIVVLVHHYGIPAKMDEIREVTEKYGAIIVEDAAEALGASYKGGKAGNLGDYNVISFNGNKIITGSSGGMFLTNQIEDAHKVKKWSTQAKEIAPWYQHEEMGYNYRMSNVIAGVIRGQIPYLNEHILQKKAIFERYKEGFKNLPVKMNGNDSGIESNHWLSCMLIEKNAMCRQNRTETTATYEKETGKTCPAEILEALAGLNAEGRSIWKPMHMQPIYKNNLFVNVQEDIAADIFERGVCLPSDNKMTVAEQEKIIAVIRACFE